MSTVCGLFVVTLLILCLRLWIYKRFWLDHTRFQHPIPIHVPTMSQFYGQNDTNIDYVEHQPLADASKQIRLIQIQRCGASEPGPVLQIFAKSFVRCGSTEKT
jgi:hypothetical protein